VPKHQREWRGFDDKILSMYGLGLSTKAIQENLKDIYNVDVSPDLVNRVSAMRAHKQKSRLFGIGDTFRRPKRSFRAVD
jgi:transposase-like protein